MKYLRKFVGNEWIMLAIFLENYEYNDSFLDFLKEHFYYEDVYTKTYGDKALKQRSNFFLGLL